MRQLVYVSMLACSSALALPVAALAAEKVKLSLGGYYHFTAYTVDQDERTVSSNGVAAQPLRSHGFVSEGEVYIKGKTVLDNGLEVGFRAEFELEADNAKRPAPSAGFGPVDSSLQYSDDLIDEVWGYIEGVFGRVVFGQEDGVADLMGFYAPRVSETNRIDDAQTYMFEDPGQPGRIYAPNGLSLRTDINETDDSTKIIYMTPRFFGVQLGVSYAPELAKNFSGFVTRQDNQLNQQSQFWEFAANYTQTFSNVDVAAYVAYLMAQVEDVSGPEVDNLEAFGFGGQIKYAGVTFGGSYKQTNAVGGSYLYSSPLGITPSAVWRDRYTTTWGLGAKYETGPWAFGLNYIRSTAELLAAGAKQHGEAYSAAVSYEVGPGIMMVLGYQHWDFWAGGTLAATGPNATPVFFGQQFTPTNASADMIYLETALSF